MRGDIWSQLGHALDFEVRRELPHTDQIDWFPGTVHAHFLEVTFHLAEA